MDFSTLSADELLRQCVQADAAGAWEEFVRRFNPVISLTVYRVAHQWGPTLLERREELVQDTYLKLVSKDFRVLRRFVSTHARMPSGL